jgi:hypothetical protein
MFTQNLNLVTTVALLVWPIVAVWLYKTRPINRATLWTILGAYMLLPVGALVKIPTIPTLDKSSIPNLAALFGCVIIGGRSIRFWHGFGLAEILLTTLLVSPFITGALNSDPIYFGTLVLPGVGIYDGGSEVITQFVALIPFFLGRQIFRTRSGIEDILRVLIIAGLIYSVPALLEVRFSPQLHTWIYGYFPSTGGGPAFSEAMRDGGFRPVVFMGHGLLVAFFFCTSTIAAAAFWRTNTEITNKVRLPASGTVAFLGIVLVLCKTTSSILYGAVIVPLIRFTRPKLQMTIAVLLVSVVLLYPTLRTADLIPTNAMVGLAASVSAERAGSLNVRFIHEGQILQHTDERFLFGWGRYGRGWVYNDRGSLVSDLDGLWIITLGTSGFIGFLALFGLLALPVFNAARALRFAESPKDRIFLSALTLILAINIVDLLPNSSLRPWTWLIAGALLGRAEALRRSARIPAGARMARETSPPEFPRTRAPSAVR